MPVLSSRITSLDGMLEQFIQFNITNDVPQVLEEDISPSFTRYDGMPPSSFNFSTETLSFHVSPVDIHQSEGNYTVSVSNPAGVSTSAVYLDVQSESLMSDMISPSPLLLSVAPPVSLELKVGGAVRYDSARTSYVAVEANRVTFTCTFQADPLPRVEWQLDGMTINTEQREYTVSSSYVNMGVPLGNYTEQLTVLSVVRANAGLYTCIGSNSHGSAQADQNLTVLGKRTTSAVGEL